nr:hypothetical protein [Tanacetum cinerariifolium]
MTYVHLLEILKRLVPNGFEKVYYCKSGAKLTSIREIKSDQDIVDLLKVAYDNGFQINMYLDHFGYDIMEMVEYDRNKELRKTRIKAELDSSDDDYHYSNYDLEEIENVDFHTKGDDSVVIKNITTQDPFLTKLRSARILFRGNVEYGLNEETCITIISDSHKDFFKIDMRCATFENGISESFNKAILGPRMKPIITMLEEIRLYIMQRIVAMNKLAFNLEDTITPSIRKRLEILKEKQREWIVYPSGIPCVRAVAAYMHFGSDLDAGVSYWGCGRSGRGDGNDGSGSGGGVNDGSESYVNDGSGSGVNDGSGRGGGRAGGRGKRGGGMAGRGSGRGSRGGVFPSSIRCGILTAEEEYQLELDEQTLTECMEEQAIAQAKIDAEQEKMDKERREEHKWLWI